MNKKIFIILIMFMLTGCYDYKELNSISIVSAEAIEYIDNEFVINVQVINPQAPEKTTTVQAPFIIYEGRGKTIQEAYLDISLKTSRDLYANHLQLLLLSKEVASNHLGDVIDYYGRNPLIRTEFYVLVMDNDNPLSIITPINEISASSIIDTVNINTNNYGTSMVVTFNDLLDWYLNPHLEIVLPIIRVIDNSKEKDSLENTNSSNIKTSYETNGISIFKDNKILGVLDKNNTVTYNYIRNNINNTTFSYECKKDKYITFEVLETKSNIKVNNKDIDILFDIRANINESQCEIDLSNNKVIIELQDNVSLFFNEYISNNTKDIYRKYNHDIFGLLDYIYKNNYGLYLNIKNNYDEYYNSLNLNVDSNFNIISEGNIIGGVYEKDK